MSSGSSSDVRFDPYSKWLGILPHDQPPNHYRLLGIDPLIEDPDIIENAAEQRMRHLRTFATGKYAQLSQQLLNQVSAAKVCLLNPEKKKAYDAKLRAKLMSGPPPRPQQANGNTEKASHNPQLVTRKKVETPVVQALQQAVPAAPQPAEVAQPQAANAGPVLDGLPATDGGTDSVLNRRRKKSMVPMLAGLVLALAAVGAIVFYVMGGKETPVAKKQPSEQTSETPVTQTQGSQEINPPEEVPQREVPVETTQIKVQTPPAEPVEDSAEREPVKKESPEEKLAEKKEPESRGEAQNLMADLDLKRDTVEGNWQKTNDGLVVNSPGPGRLIIARNPPQNYELRFTAERVDIENNIGAIHVGIPLENRQLEVVLDYKAKAGKSWESGFMTVQNTLQKSSEMPEFPNGKPIETIIRVTMESLSIFIDGELIETFRAPYNDYRDMWQWRVPDQNAIALGVFQGAFRFRAISLNTARSPETTDVIASEEGSRDELRGPDVTKKLLPVPDESALADAQKIIDEVFSQEIQAARTPEDKTNIAADFLQKAKETHDDPAGEYAMLMMARKFAVEGGSARGVMAIYDRAGEEFEIDDLSDRSTALLEASKAARKPDQNKDLAIAVGVLAAQLADAERYDDMTALLRLATSAATASRDTEFRKEVAAGVKRIGQMRDAFEQADKARAQIADKPDDPAANLTLGRYLCLVKRNWQEGLPYLIKSSDEALKEIAALEIRQPAKAEQQMELADLLWDAAHAHKENDVERFALADHALQWYKKALPGITGLHHKRIEDRVKELRSEVAKDPSSGGQRTMDLSNWFVSKRVGNGFSLDNSLKNALALKDGVLTARYHPNTRADMAVCQNTKLAGDFELSVELRGTPVSLNALYDTGDNRCASYLWEKNDNQWHTFTLQRVGNKYIATVDGSEVNLILWKLDASQPVMNFCVILDSGKQVELRGLSFK